MRPSRLCALTLFFISVIGFSTCDAQLPAGAGRATGLMKRADEAADFLALLESRRRFYRIREQREREQTLRQIERVFQERRQREHQEHQEHQDRERERSPPSQRPHSERPVRHPPRQVQRLVRWFRIVGRYPDGQLHHQLRQTLHDIARLHNSSGRPRPLVRPVAPLGVGAESGVVPYGPLEELPWQRLTSVPGYPRPTLAYVQSNGRPLPPHDVQRLTDFYRLPPPGTIHLVPQETEMLVRYIAEFREPRGARRPPTGRRQTQIQPPGDGEAGNPPHGNGLRSPPQAERTSRDGRSPSRRRKRR